MEAGRLTSGFRRAWIPAAIPAASATPPPRAGSARVRAACAACHVRHVSPPSRRAAADGCLMVRAARMLSISARPPSQARSPRRRTAPWRAAARSAIAQPGIRRRSSSPPPLRRGGDGRGPGPAAVPVAEHGREMARDAGQGGVPAHVGPVAATGRRSELRRWSRASRNRRRNRPGPTWSRSPSRSFDLIAGSSGWTSFRARAASSGASRIISRRNAALPGPRPPCGDRRRWVEPPTGGRTA